MLHLRPAALTLLSLQHAQRNSVQTQIALRRAPVLSRSRPRAW